MFDEERAHRVRVWMNDRPGALGAIAGRIGELGGGIVGIEIIDRDGGEAVDDLIVTLPVATDGELLARTIAEVDGARVEHVLPLDGPIPDPRLEALEGAWELRRAVDDEGRRELLVRRVHRELDATWAAVVIRSRAEVAIAAGPAPAGAWLVAFVTGVDESTATDTTPGVRRPDTVAATIEADVSLVVGRESRGFLPRERRAIELLAGLAAPPPV